MIYSESISWILEPSVRDVQPPVMHDSIIVNGFLDFTAIYRTRNEYWIVIKNVAYRAFESKGVIVTGDPVPKLVNDCFPVITSYGSLERSGHGITVINHTRQELTGSWDLAFGSKVLNRKYPFNLRNLWPIGEGSRSKVLTGVPPNAVAVVCSESGHILFSINNTDVYYLVLIMDNEVVYGSRYFQLSQKPAQIIGLDSYEDLFIVYTRNENYLIRSTYELKSVVLCGEEKVRSSAGWFLSENRNLKSGI
jgi:hypothetical protein